MSSVNARPAWTADFENDLFNGVITKVAPHLPLKPPAETRDAQTAAEIAEVAEFTARVAAHDTFIVQAISKAITHLDIDTDFHLKLSRQVGDDGHHAEVARERLIALTGEDQLPLIEGYIRQLWAALGDLPYRDLFGFLAFQFHYELHIQGRLRAEGRTAKIRYGRKKEVPDATATGQEANDELVHRINIVQWVQKILAGVPPEQREDWIARLIAADDEAQRALNPYLRHRIANAGRAWQSDLTNVTEIYDTFRREVLAYLVEKPAAALPALTSLAA
ncbi:hypothetical protein D3874_04245 [Oleomonas cavernae]|uniref:Ferritin-like domain-containing protein n=1 Tax=Oleomonas cavernae TaxID=2320859 RepID=A0A418W8K3_9PROT|nr:hypothetical protein [Oleomonas cavernae]RJF86333.1 hypothetical protein D3874_04245 [Oleomonas cavernae]